MMRFILLTILMQLSYASQAQDTIQFPIPTFFKLHSIADDMVFNGVDMSIIGFDTNKDKEEIFDFYQDAWHGKIKQSIFGDWVIYSHLNDGLLYTVQFQQLNKLQISGTLTISNLPRLKKNQVKNLAEGLPMPANTKVANDIKAYDGGRESRQLLLVNNMSVASNMTYYKSTLTGQGWILQHEEISPNSNGAGAALLLAKDNSTINVAMISKDSQTFIQVVRMDK